MASADSRRASHGFVELGEDLSHSPLWNADLAPTTIAQRTWSVYNIAALWVGMSVVISTYLLAAGLIEQGMAWWQALLTILLGNVIVLIPMVLNAHAGTKYGVSFPVLCRASFGTRGAHIPGLLRSLVACGWFGIQTWIGGNALDTIIGVIWSGWVSVGAHNWIAFFAFWGIQVVILVRGMQGIKVLESFGAPLLLRGGGLLLLWAFRTAGGWSGIVSGADRLRGAEAGQTSFWRIFWPGLTANVGYWATLSLNIPDFTRYARSQREQMLGQALGLPTTMFTFSFIGAIVTSATVVVYGKPVWDPVELVSRFGRPAVIFFAMLIVMVAQVTTNMAANVVAPATGFSNLSPRRISFLTGSLITALLGVVMMPWRIMQSAGDYIFTWLIGYSSLMGALAGILICDYWVLRRQRLALRELYDPAGRYGYGAGGINGRAVAALVLAVLPVVPGFLRAASTPGGVVADPDFFDSIYTYAWFVTFGLSFAIYALLMKGRLRED
ncbi:MAG: NCS1 family nucleobase:cation symporter-1 [Candidatus Krumholzibacteriia bacterium]